MSKKIGIIGQGFVGNAVKEGFKNYFNIETFDIIKEKSSTLNLEDLVNKCKIIFLCIPTPMEKSGKCNLKNIITTLSELNEISKKYKDVSVIIKSTVPPGTCDMLQGLFTNLAIIFNPEFLTENNSIQDFKNQDRIVLGGPIISAAKKIYKKVFPLVPVIKTDFRTAEMIKYTTNCFLSTKLSFANEIYQICQKLSINYNEMINIANLDPRLGKSFWQVPGWDGQFGFSSQCLPKDLNGLITVAKEIGVDPKVLEAVWNKNLEVRPSRDWENLVGRCVVDDKEE